MPVHIKHFDRDKALEVILYIARSLRNPTFHSISKMLYLSTNCTCRSMVA